MIIGTIFEPEALSFAPPAAETGSERGAAFAGCPPFIPGHGVLPSGGIYPTEGVRALPLPEGAPSGPIVSPAAPAAHSLPPHAGQNLTPLSAGISCPQFSQYMAFSLAFSYFA